MILKAGLSICVAIAAILALSGVSQGAATFTDRDLDGPRFADIHNAGALVIGNQFTIGSVDVQVDALGVWDQADDGLVVSHDVGLWNSGGVLVASATVPAGTASVLEDSFRYVALGSYVTLLAGQQYRIGALFPTGPADPFNDPWDPDGDGNPANSPAISDGVAVAPGSGIASVDGDYFVFGPVLAEPTNFGGGTPGRWGSANARLIPEPTSIALAGLCGLLTLVRRRRTA